MIINRKRDVFLLMVQGWTFWIWEVLDLITNGHTFAEHLRILREKIGISQREFAEVMGIARETYSKYETGTRTPTIDFLTAVHEKTGCSVQYLLGYSDNMNPENAAIGSQTGLSDTAIDMLGKVDAETLNSLIEHPRFPQLVRAVAIMMNPTETDEYTDRVQSLKGTTTFFEYALFTATCIIQEIAREKQSDRQETIQAFRAARYEREKHQDVYESVNEKMGNYIKHLREADIQADEEEKKRAEHDPLLRFKRKLIGKEDAHGNPQSPE